MLFGFGFAFGGLFCVVMLYGFNKIVWKDKSKVDIKRMWALLNESNGETMTLKLFRHENDPKPFRAMIFVEGEEAVEQVDVFLKSIAGETFTTPKFKA